MLEGIVGNCLENTLNPFFILPTRVGSQQAQSVPCPHGYACPVCMEQRKSHDEYILKLQEGLEQRKLDYDRRCKEYMEKYRKGER
jgi:hypothetical protein